jgi:tRNA(Ile)-lysidine synthase
VAPPVAASFGAVWDGRFRLAGPGRAGCMIGALGPAAGLRRAGRGLPATILSTLPAIRRDGVLVAVPGLLYPDAASCEAFRTFFAPATGPVAG